MKLKLNVIAGLFVLAFCLEAKAQPAAQEVISFAAPVIDCYAGEQSLDAERCEMEDFLLPQTVGDASGNFRVRISDRRGRQWWVREGDVVFQGAAEGLSGLSGAPLQGRGARASLDDRLREVILAGAEAPRGRAAAAELIAAQEAMLREYLSGSGAGVRRVSDAEIVVNVPADLVFDFESARLKRDSAYILAPLARVLGQEQALLVDVRGYTDSNGNASFNQDISERRAMEIANALMSAGVRRQRLLAAGFGDTQPIASNASALGRSQNRRIEISIRVFAAGRE